MSSPDSLRVLSDESCKTTDDSFIERAPRSQTAQSNLAQETSGLIPFFSLTREELGTLLSERFGIPSYRSTQLFEWVYRHGITDFNQMTNISKRFREDLASLFVFPTVEIHSRQISNDGTRKYAFKVQRGDLVESVMIKQPTRMTLCVSSQVGCGMGCKFCRTATMGFVRHLGVEEIVMQVRGVIEDAKNFGDSFQNIVFMGMGEPLHNFEGVSRAARILTDTNGLAISPKKITISTVGLVPAIKRFGDEGVPANLAVSLNATTDEIRSRIMPVNNRFSLDELLGAIKGLPLKPRQTVTMEYVMLCGVNDTPQDMERLAALMRPLPVKVNLIPYNENAGLGFKTPEESWVYKWRDYLLAKDVNTTIRWSKGVDINAACGQLVTTSGKKRHASVANATH